MNRSLLLSAPLGPLLLVLGASVASGQTCTTTRISVGPGGQEVAAGSGGPMLTPDGRFVAYWSMADGLTANDSNGWFDVFLHDRQTGTNELVSVSSSGAQGDGDSYDAFVSDDGRFVVFTSEADNLVPGDTNGFPDVFVRDLLTQQTIRASVRSDGTEANEWSGAPGISADGLWVVFRSDADNLVPGDTNGQQDVFVFDRAQALTTRASVSSAGVEGDGWSAFAGISGDGRWVVFESMATNLVPGDTNGYGDVFLKDRQTGAVTLVDVGPGGVQADLGAQFPVISADGLHVAFESPATNLVPGDDLGSYDVFVHDVASGLTTMVSVSALGVHGPGIAFGPLLSPDGRFVVFNTANALEAGDTNGAYDVYVRDLAGQAPVRVSYTFDGQQPVLNAISGSISADASVIAFVTDDATIVPNDTNLDNDVFVRHCPFPPAPVYVSSCISTVIDCPCHNVGVGWGGCDNSEATGGAELAAHGTPSMAADTLRLTAWRLPADVPGLFLQAPIGLPVTPWGDGLLCIGGGTIRLGVRFAAGGMVQLGYGLPGDPVLSVESALPPTGGTRSYQLVYRNPDPAFCLPDTFNSSNAITVVWTP